MEIISALLVSLSLFFTGFMSPAEPSVEVGISTVSPAGIQGGYAVPASGCSHVHDNDCATPTIDANKELISPGNSVVISWNPDNHNFCELSANLTGDPTAIGSETVILETTTRFSIECFDGPFETAFASVQVEVTPTTFEI
jgi:hypothetical protein